MAIFQILIPSMCDAFWLYLFCRGGDELTNRFASVSNQAYQFDWYLLPIEMQRCLMLMMMASQKNVYIRGAGGTQCTRDTYKKVIVFIFLKFLEF